jgi:hypothetical protein
MSTNVLRRHVMVNGYSTHAEYVLYHALIPGFESVSSSLSSETSRAIAVESVLVNSIAAENIRAQQVENSLNVNLSGEIARATQSENILNAKINNEITRAISSESQIYDNCKAYTDNQLQSILGANVAGALEQLHTLGTLLGDNSLQSNLLEELGDITDAIKKETSRAETVEANLQAQITINQNNINTAIASLQTQVNNNKISATNAIADLQSQINTTNSTFTMFQTATNCKFSAIAQAFGVIFDAFSIEKYPGSAPDYFIYNGNLQCLGTSELVPAPNYSAGTWNGSFTYTYIMNAGCGCAGALGTGTISETGSQIFLIKLSRTMKVGTTITFTPTFSTSTPPISGNYTYKLFVNNVQQTDLSHNATTTGLHVLSLQAFDGSTLASTIIYDSIWAI